jgi:hypothetical protein
MTTVLPQMKNKDKRKPSSKSKSAKLLSTPPKDKKRKTTVVYKVKVKKPKLVKSTAPLNISVQRDSDVEVIESVKQDPSAINVEVASEPYDDEGKRPRRRGRNKKEKIYFSKATQEAVVEYNAQPDWDIRNNIYNERIKFSFEKLVENIYNTFKFTYFDSGPLEIQRETVAHLVANMNKYAPEKGKAFSYFSIVAKNYLIFHNNNNYKRFNQHVEISEMPSEDTVCLQTEDDHHRKVQTQEFMKLLIDYWEKNVAKIFGKAKDLNIAYAVIELFRNCERIENFNKKTLYLYIREISNCKTQQITKVLNKMKCYQNLVARNYTNKGTIH